MKKIWIYSGGRLEDWALTLPEPGDILIGADRGALFLVQHGFRPDVAVGDFDSVTEEELKIIRAGSDRFEDCDPIMKDYSDTELAFQTALQFNPSEIILTGALGTRFDHSLANVHLLRKALQLGVSCRLLDDHNEIRLTDRQLEVSDPERQYTHVSLLPLTIKVTGVTLEGFAYPLHNATLELGQSLAVSNVLIGSKGLVQIRSGLLLVIQSKD